MTYIILSLSVYLNYVVCHHSKTVIMPMALFTQFYKSKIFLKCL